VSPSTPSTDVLTVKEAAALSCVSAATLYRSLERDEIPRTVASKVGGQWRVRRAELLSFLFSTEAVAS